MVNTGVSVCPGSSDPFYVVTYYIIVSLLPGHTVWMMILSVSKKKLSIYRLRYYIK